MITRSIFQFFRYLRYLYHAKNEHAVHSPFVYDLYTNIIKERKPYYIFANIESVRSRLLLNNSSIRVTDFGTGQSSKRKIASIATNSLKNTKAAELLFRLVNHFQSKYILELGTSLGITTSYLAAVNAGVEIHTLEGCPETAEVARKNFEILRLENITLHVGAFEETLEGVLNNLPNLDFVFIDGNHRKAPTIQYFERCLKKANHSTIFVLDDIHWSSEMEEAWMELKSRPVVTASIDLFEVGILIIDENVQKQDYILRF